MRSHRSLLQEMRRRLQGRAAWPLAALAYAMAIAVVSPSVRQHLPGHAESAPEDGTPATVAAVVDGDTFAIEGGGAVRILGLDAPETHNPNMAGAQAFGLEASTRLSAMLEGRQVVLESDVVDRDHYGRLLRHVWVKGELVAEVLLSEGLAYAMSIPPNLRHADRLRSAEESAKAAGRGLWGLPRPTPLPLFSAPVQ